VGVHARQCGRSLVIEHDGSMYACDHCVYPQFRLGIILTDTFPGMVEESLRTQFGISKESTLPRCCRKCEVLGWLPARADVPSIASPAPTTMNQDCCICTQGIKSFSGHSQVITRHGPVAEK
jgi:radical SAM protein with 4Fe4S-binding SPASM domain